MRLNDTAAYTVGDKIVLECETINETMSVRWFQNGREITTSKRAIAKTEGTVLKKITKIYFKYSA